MSPWESAAPLASTYATINTPVEVPIATKPAMVASENQRARGPRSTIAVDSMAAFLVNSNGASVGCFFAGGPGEEHDASGQQEVHATTDPHDQTAELLVFDRAEAGDARCKDVG